MSHTIPQLLGAVRALVEVIEKTRDNTEGRWPEADTWCQMCTYGTAPGNHMCAYHRAKEILAGES